MAEITFEAESDLNGEMIVGVAAVIETMDEDGKRSLHTRCTPEMSLWAAAGMFTAALDTVRRQLDGYWQPHREGGDAS